MDMKTIGKWSYLVGVVVAVVTALVSYTADWLSIVLAILADVAALFWADPDELTNYGVRFLLLAIVAAALDSFPFVGEYVTYFANGLLTFFAPALLTMLIVFNVKQAINWIKS